MKKVRGGGKGFPGFTLGCWGEGDGQRWSLTGGFLSLKRDWAKGLGLGGGLSNGIGLGLGFGF